MEAALSDSQKHITLRLSEEEVEILNKEMEKEGEDNRTRFIKSRLFSNDKISMTNQSEILLSKLVGLFSNSSQGEDSQTHLLLEKLVDLTIRQGERIGKVESYLEELSDNLVAILEGEGKK